MLKKADEAEKCADCSQVFGACDKVIGCEVCDRWFHIKCQGVSEETYQLFKRNTGIHWYCKGYDSGAVKILKAMVSMQQREDKMEERQV